jgi:ankyrin repeat protein
MPVIEFWYCSECFDGPSGNWQARCQACDHKRCKGCRVEKDRQQAPNISLHTAVKGNNGALVQQLLDRGADVNMKDSNSDTALHLAIKLGLFDIVRVLLENGADVNVRNSHSHIPLYFAIIRRNLDIVRVLLENGADVNVRNSHSNTPLYTAILLGNSDIVRVLLENGADVNPTNSGFYTPLHLAIERGHFNIVRVLLENGADVNVRNSHSHIPLHFAILHEDLHTIRVLLEKGADVNLTNSDFDTPLHIAIAHKHFDIIKTLLRAGANVNIPRGSGETALTMALQRKLHNVVEVLLEAGALLKEAIQDRVLRYRMSQSSGVELVVKWRVPQFVQNELLGKVDDLRKVVTLTGSVENAQMISVEEYVAQTWKDNGLRVLDALIEMMQTGYAELDMSAGKTATFKTDRRGLLRMALKTSQELTVDIMEQIAWLGSVFTYEMTKSKDCGPFLATGYYSLSSTSQYFRLSIVDYPLEGYLDEPCWTSILRSATLAIGFPVRKRQEGIGLEIPFPLLLRFADISVSMEYDGGTLLVGASTILFPSRILEDGVQWHVTDATSAQDAVEVINRSPDWIRTDDIGQLAEHRAYLGYCSHAQVLLGTRELIMSQHTVELQSLLPKSKSQIELVHEGTMSAGFSIRGIFNTTIGGKWIVPPRLNVPLEDNRDLEDLLMNAHRRPVLVYDRKEDRGWLVPELSLVFHMALAYLHQTNVRQRCQASVREALPYLNAAVDGGLEAYNLVKDHWNLSLYEKIEDGQMKTLGMVIRDFMKDLQKLRTAENVRRQNKGFQLTLPVFGSRSLRGWDFSELALKTENIFQREMKWEHGGPLWTMLGDSEDMLVILGSSFGNLIRPNLAKTKVASGWETIPMGAELLTATNSCIKHLGQNQVLPTVNGMLASKQHSGDLFWYSPATFHTDCNQYCNQSCLVIHEIARSGSLTCTQTRNPRELQEEGAVVFGCASTYHKSLERRKSETQKHRARMNRRPFQVHDHYVQS